MFRLKSRSKDEQAETTLETLNDAQEADQPVPAAGQEVALREDSAIRLNAGIRDADAEAAAGHRHDAVRVLLKAMEETGTADGGDFYHEVKEVIGAEGRARLVSAMSHFPCFACGNGYEDCSACDGTGFSALEQTCRACAGFGQARCDFCNGSGLAAYHTFPRSFRYHVIVHRARLALKHLQQRIEARAANPPTGIERLTAEVMDLNKLLGLIENAAIAAEESAAAGDVKRETAEQLVQVCRKAGGDEMQAMLRSVGALAQAWRRTSEDPAAQEPRMAAERAAFFEELLAGGQFGGTSLHHPMLSGAPQPQPPMAAR